MRTAYKVTRANGRDFATDQIDYSAIGQVVEWKDGGKQCDCRPRHDGPCPASIGACGKGLHVSPTPQRTCRFGNTGVDRGRWRWWEVLFNEADLLAGDHEKFRVARLTVVREILREEIFPGLDQRVMEAKAEIATWKSIPWLKPSRRVTDEEVQALVTQWYERIAPYHVKGNRGLDLLPRCGRIVRQHNEAARYAVDADAVAAVAVAVAADAAAAVAAAAADAADIYRLWPYWCRWYCSPRYALWRMVRWRLAGLPGPNPWEPLVELMKLGCAPLGYSKLPGEETAFTVYVPEVQS